MNHRSVLWGINSGGLTNPFVMLLKYGGACGRAAGGKPSTKENNSKISLCPLCSAMAEWKESPLSQISMEAY